MHKLEMPLGRHTLSIETGRMAKQADGSVLVRLGDTVVLATACAQKEPRVGVDFMPLTVDYRENTYAGGKIPGGFFKREGRPNEKEILTSRLGFPTACRSCFCRAQICLMTAWPSLRARTISPSDSSWAPDSTITMASSVPATSRLSRLLARRSEVAGFTTHCPSQ